jgi:hypothetical protein
MGRHHVVDEAYQQRFLGADGIAGQDHFVGALAAYVARQALRAAKGRRKAQPDFGLGKARVFGRNRDAAGFHGFTAAAEGNTVDGRDDGFGVVFDAPCHGLAAHHEVAVRRLGRGWQCRGRSPRCRRPR